MLHQIVEHGNQFDFLQIVFEFFQSILFDKSEKRT